MIRNNDETGVSGTGKVLEAVLFGNGMLVTHWFGKFESINVYKSYEDFLEIHVKSHPQNGTTIVWNDGAMEEY